MRIILPLIILLFFYISSYGSDNITILNDNTTIDNTTKKKITTTSKNSKKPKKKKTIKPKLVPDRYINDKNTYMEDFGFPTSEEFQINTDIEAQDRGLYDDVKISLKNRWSTENMWGKDFLYIESVLSAGMTGFNYFSIRSRYATQKEYIIPYGSLSLKLFSGTIFSPEITIKESKFIFRESLSYKEELEDSYNYYYIKFPLGFHIPFFGWKSEMYLDFSYSTLNSNFQVNEPLYVRSRLLEEGDSFHMSTSAWKVKLFFDTPVVLKPSISEYAYFGFYYNEGRSSHTATVGEDYDESGAWDGTALLVDGIYRDGGIFYDMRLNLYKGIMFGIKVYAGIGDIEPTKRYNIEYSNEDWLLAYFAEMTLGYQYIFKKYNIGLAFDVGASYSGYLQFFTAKNSSLYNITLDGDVKYFVELKFLFGY